MEKGAREQVTGKRLRKVFEYARENSFFIFVNVLLHRVDGKNARTAERNLGRALSAKTRGNSLDESPLQRAGTVYRLADRLLPQKRRVAGRFLR